jgi:uncharacterized protein YajQ (UPF0234 family)
MPLADEKCGYDKAMRTQIDDLQTCMKMLQGAIEVPLQFVNIKR